MSATYGTASGNAMPLILIVDDDATTNQMLQYTLIREGFQTLTAFTVAEALNQINDGRPDLVLLDVSLPDGTGFDVCHALHKEHGGIPMPILFISANEDTATKVNALEAGAVDYIGKPIAIPEVLARVRTHLRLRDVSATLEKIHEQERMLQILVDAAPDAILMMDPKGHISYYNHAAETLFGWTAEEILGADLHRVLMSERHLPDFEKGFEEFRKSGTGFVVGLTRELNARHKDGQEFPIEISVSSAMLQGGWHAIGIIRDISKRKSSS